MMEDWQLRIGHIRNLKDQFREAHFTDLSIRPVVVFIEDRGDLWTYGYDACLVGGLLEWNLVYKVVVQDGEQVVIPELKIDAGLLDFLMAQLEKIDRSLIVAELFRPGEEPSGSTTTPFG